MTGDRFLVEGGHPLRGTVTPAGNKNEALPVLAACLLVAGEVVVDNVPRIRDVTALLEGLRHLGVRVDVDDHGTVRLDASDLKGRDPDPAVMSQLRGSVLLAPGLLARTGQAVLPPPGGDRIGRRRLDTHLLALSELGARVAAGPSLHLTLEGRFRGTEVFLDEMSVTGTENTVMAAVLAEGETVILNAASEPHVQGLCRFLNALGARISGIGTNQLRIQGVRELGPGRHRLGPDHIEIGSFVALAAMTGGDLRIRDVIPEDLRMIRLAYRRLGVETSLDGTTLVVPGPQKQRRARQRAKGKPRPPAKSKRSRLSKSFSWMSPVPWLWVASTSASEVRSAGKPGQGASSTLGMAPSASTAMRSCCGPGTTRVVPSSVVSTPRRW